ncbi:MAG TPA: Ig-like domain-containing protein, partial [Candidatus Rifleibacterium sp.]|nr:Ig-like domain-containing protein [Candidatus Rifleibacterium sp.]
MYSTSSDLLKTPYIEKNQLSTTINTAKPHATVVSKNKIYVFWIDNTSNLRVASSIDATSWTDEGAVAGSGIDSNLGPYGCLIKSGSNEYIAVAFRTSTTTIKIISFPDGTISPYDSTTINTGAKNVDGSAVSLSQNPRNGRVVLSWYCEVDKKIYFHSGKFEPAIPGRFSFTALPTSVDTGKNFSGTYGLGSSGGPNFENSLILPSAAGLYNYIIKDGNIVQGELLTPAGHPTQFNFFENGDWYCGLVILSSLSKFDFYTRKLKFPDKCSWQADQKVLHLEGPPQTGSQVRIAVDFAEPKAEYSKVRTVNAGTVGGFRDLASGYRVIASFPAGNEHFFSLYFDKPMRLASYPILIGVNAPVRLFDSLNQPVAITHIASTANELVFRPVDDLQLNATYKISIASSVIDNNGSQIYENATFTFTTQNSSSQVQTDEINSIAAFNTQANAIAGSGGEIASGSEVNSSATIYLRVNCVDPAFNTIDTLSADVVIDDAAPLTTLTLTESAANSGAFIGSYTISSPTGGTHTCKFKTAKSSVYHPVYVSFPTLAPGTPASAAINVPVNSTITVIADESLNEPVDPANISLLLDGNPVAHSFVYTNASKQITITPTATLASEKTYIVSVSKLKDARGNPQIQPLAYSFTVEDKTPPILTPASPASATLNVPIGATLTVSTSESLAAALVNNSNITLTIDGSTVPAVVSYDDATKLITIDPTGSLGSEKLCVVSVKNQTDLRGNPQT